MMDRKSLVKALEEIALLLELKNTNPFKIRSYSNGARALGQMDDDVVARITSGDIAKEKGFGDSLVSKLQELVETGELQYLNDLRAEFPATLMELFDIPGLGPKKIAAVYKELKVVSMADLEAACTDGRLAALSGMGKKTAENILASIEQRRSTANLFLYPAARAAAEEILAAMREVPELARIEIAGSLRRYKTVTKDMDLVGASDDPEAVMNAFCALPQASRVVAHGKTKSQILLENGLSVDLRIVSPEVFPCALHHFTGSKDHNVAMRALAIKQGKKLSEWGLFEVAADGTETPLPITCEADIFAGLGLAEIPPELREGLGEVAEAASKPIPKLVTADDYRGVLHCHTHASDGSNSIEEMIEHAKSLGYSYIGITDHSVSSVQANGLDADRLLAHIEKIREAQAAVGDQIRVFASSECDILTSGELDYPDDVLAQLDYFVISVHNGFSKDADVMTKRLIKAIEHPGSRILGHATGRLLLRRDGYPVHLEKVIDAAIANNVAIEFNCNPRRMDMDWLWFRKARDRGLLCSLNSDAHNLASFAYTDAGIGFCRKGYLTADDIINCWPTPRLATWLRG